MRRERIGFTLIEVLLVSMLLSVVALAVFKAFSDGVALWKRVNVESRDEDLNIFFSDVTARLTSAFVHASVRFEGGRDRIAFPAIVPFEFEDGVRGTVGRVMYFYDGADDSICVEQADYSRVYEGRRGTIRSLLKGAVSLRFSYYCRDPEEKKFLWVREWRKDELPANVDAEKTLPVAVKITVEFREGNEYKEYTRTVALPVGG